MALEAEICDWIGGEVALLYEKTDIGQEQDDGEGEESAIVAGAILTIGPPEGSWSFTAGRQYMPFGLFETNLISDVLNFEIGETNETTVQFGLSSGGFRESIFGFDGDNDKAGDRGIPGHGATVGFSLEREESEFALDLGYISDIGDSDSLKEVIADTLGSNSVTEHVPGWVASARLRYEKVSLLGEYLAWIERFAVDEVEFAGHGAKPTSWLIEAAYDFGLAGKDATVAAGYQGQAEALALKLPTLRFLAGLSVAIIESFALAIEWSYDESASKDGGSGERANTIKVQVATEF